MRELNREAFEGVLNQSFQVGPFVGPDGARVPFELQLVEVLRQDPNGHPESYVVRFRGPPSPVLAQGTYPFTHAELGTHPVFVVTTGRDARGADYEAVFNQG